MPDLDVSFVIELCRFKSHFVERSITLVGCRGLFHISVLFEVLNLILEAVSTVQRSIIFQVFLLLSVLSYMSKLKVEFNY